MLRWILLFSLLIFQTACDSPADQERPASSLLNSRAQVQAQAEAAPPNFEPLIATDLLNEPTLVYRFETTAEALSIWRRATVERPTLF